MENIFQQCGLTPTEQMVLTHLLQFGRRRPGLIAKSTRVKRSTVYSALEALETKRLVRKSYDGSSIVYSAASASEIPKILRAEAEHGFDALSSAISHVAEYLKRFPTEQSQNFAGFEVRELLSSRSYETVMMDYVTKFDFLAVWNPSATIVSSKMKLRIKEYLAKSRRRKSSIQEILVAGPLTTWYVRQIRNPKHLTKLFAPTQGLNADILIVNNSVLFSQTNSTGSESAIEITNPEIVNLMTQIFRSWWQLLPES